MVVMTTEVLRNMLYERSDTLDGLISVVMDEVHYLQDPYRGAVWEEVLIHLPLSRSRVVCLSATISNAEEFGEWIGTLRGETRVVIEERRPVPLEHHYLVGPRPAPDARRAGRHACCRTRTWSRSTSEELRYEDLLPAGERDAAAPADLAPARGPPTRVRPPARGGRRGPRRRRACSPRSTSCSAGRGATGACEWLRESGIAPHDAGPRPTASASVAETRAAWMDEEDLETLGFYDFLDGARRRASPPTTPGMLPVFKETVEELFEAGLVKVVFATETLSLGINMPAKIGRDRGPVEVPGRAARAAHARASTRSSPGARAGAGSTSSGHAVVRVPAAGAPSSAWRRSRPRARTTSPRRSGPRTTWR